MQKIKRKRIRKKDIFGVDINWELKHHSTDLGVVMNPEDCKFIGTKEECKTFIKDNKND